MRAKRKRNGQGVEGQIKAIRSDLEALQRDLKGLASGGVALAEGQAMEVAHAAAERAQDLKDRAQDLVEELENWGLESIEDVRDSVRSQPLAACALSMGAGALVGALLLRR